MSLRLLLVFPLLFTNYQSHRRTFARYTLRLLECMMHFMNNMIYQLMIQIGLLTSIKRKRIKPAIFKAFFNTNKIQLLMDSHGLQFDWKVIFINKWAICLLGKAKPGKAFIKSNFE